MRRFAWFFMGASALFVVAWVAGCETERNGSRRAAQSFVTTSSIPYDPTRRMEEVDRQANPWGPGERGIYPDVSKANPVPDELWIVERGQGRAPPSDDSPRGGELRTRRPDGSLAALLLKHMDVRADVAVCVSWVRVRQEYHNPFPEKIEAVYVFPLPHDAAVRDFIMTIGERRIRGIIREREEARQIYAEARRQGHVASLLAEERPNVFTQSVANIEPGKSIDVEIAYFHVLPYTDGEYELVFPWSWSRATTRRASPTGSRPRPQGPAAPDGSPWRSSTSVRRA